MLAQNRAAIIKILVFDLSLYGLDILKCALRRPLPTESKYLKFPHQLTSS